MKTMIIFFRIKIFIIFLLSYVSTLYAEEMPLGIFVGGDDSYSAAPSQGITVSTGGKLTMRLHASCFPTNLRGVANPISPSSLIKSQFDLSVGNERFNFYVTFPGYITTQKGMSSSLAINPIQKNGQVTFTKPGPTNKVEQCTFMKSGTTTNTTTYTNWWNTNYTSTYNFWGGTTTNTCSILGCNTTTNQILDVTKCKANGYTTCNIYGTICSKVTNIPVSYVVDYQYHDLPTGSIAGIYGNTVQVNLTSATVALKPDSTGKATVSVPTPKLNSYSFTQEIIDCSTAGGAVYGHVGYSSYTPSYACGAYMAKNGAVTASVSNFKVSSDNSTVDVSVAFPGQTGFCGGYWSPLMVFFDEDRPLFTNISDFPLNPGGRTSWVEAKSKGYFLVYDEKLDGKINSKEQLFGDSEKYKNGFENLAQYDSNKDGWINAKDKKFKHLFLWNDKNGNGISEKTELFPAKDKLIKISLKYNPGSLRPIGKYAEEREKAKFYYKKAEKTVAGDIIDIWLSPQSQTSLAVNGQ